MRFVNRCTQIIYGSPMQILSRNSFLLQTKCGVCYKREAILSHLWIIQPSIEKVREAANKRALQSEDQNKLIGRLRILSVSTYIRYCILSDIEFSINALRLVGLFSHESLSGLNVAWTIVLMHCRCSSYQTSQSNIPTKLFSELLLAKSKRKKSMVRVRYIVFINGLKSPLLYCEHHIWFVKKQVSGQYLHQRTVDNLCTAIHEPHTRS